MGIIRLVLATSIVTALVLAVLAGPAAAEPRPVTIDLSSVGAGTMPRDAFNRDGVVFDADGYVIELAGDAALAGGDGFAETITGSFNGVADRVGARVVLLPSGRFATAELTLTALDGEGVVAATSIVVSADRDQEGSIAYAALDTGRLPRPATRFAVTGRGLRNEYEHCPRCFTFGMAELSLTLDAPQADPFAPILTVPPRVRVNASSPAGAVVPYAVRVTDDRDPGAAATCSPPPGSTFAIGTTAVTCTARDAAGNVAAPRSFTIEVGVPGRRLPHRGRDHVVGFGSVVGGAQRFRLFAEASPTGRNPRGTLSGTGAYTFAARVTCVRVEGNRATVGGEVTVGAERVGRGVVATYEDNGDGPTPDRIVAYLFLPEPPADCAQPAGASPLTIDGDVDVHDAPRLPLARHHCRDGGWRRYEVFRTERECLRFVASGARRPHRGE